MDLGKVEDEFDWQTKAKMINLDKLSKKCFNDIKTPTGITGALPDTNSSCLVARVKIKAASYFAYLAAAPGSDRIRAYLLKKLRIQAFVAQGRRK